MNGSGMGVIALTALGGAIIVSTDLQLQSAESSLAATCTAPGLQKKSVDLNVGDIIN